MARVRDLWHDARTGARTARYGKGKRWLAETPKGAPDKSFHRKEDARRHVITVEAEQQRGEYIDRSSTVTVTEYAVTWAAGRPHRPTTAQRVDSLIRVHITGTSLGKRRLSAVRPSEVQAWAADRARVLSPSTLRNLVSLLRSIYAAAVLDRLVASSPVVKVSLPSARRERLVPLTVEQVRALAAAVPLRNRAMVITQAGLGLRIGELLALRADRVDFLRRTVRIDEQFAPGQRTRSGPKTPTSRRTLPLPQVVAEALAEHMRVFPPLPDGTLFHTTAARPYRHDYYGSNIFGAAVERAGLPAGTTSHALRHHFASVLLAAGESVVAVAELLGHENAALVLSTYGHLLPNREDRMRRAVDSAWSAPAETAQERNGGTR